MVYLLGVFAAVVAGIFLYGLTGVFGAGAIGSVVVFLISASIIRGWREPLREPGEVRKREAGVYGSHGVYSGSDGGGGFGGGGDGGGGGSC